MFRSSAGSTSSTSRSAEVLTSPSSSAYTLQSYASGNAGEPPDTQLAAGPSTLLEGVNQTLAAYDKTGLSLGSTATNTFFGVATGWQTTDPRVEYDSAYGHFVVSMAAYNSTTITTCAADPSGCVHDSAVYLAVSTGSAPTPFTTGIGGNWVLYTVANNAGTGLCDQPRLGLSTVEVLVTCDMFDTSENYLGENTWVYSRADVEAGSASPHLYQFKRDPSIYALVPAWPQTPTATAYAAYNNADPYPPLAQQSQGHPTLAVITYTGDPATGVSAAQTFLSTVGTIQPPPAAQPGTSTGTTPSGASYSCDPNLSTNNCINSGDDRVDTVTWSNGQLWVGANDACTPTPNFYRSCLRLWEVTTGGGLRMAQDYDIGSSGADFYYPAPTVDSNGDMVVGYSWSTQTHYASGGAIDQLAGSSSLDTSVTVQNGAGIYAGGRWGDYGGIATDPSDPATVWVTSEYATADGAWGTAAKPYNAGNPATTGRPWTGGHDAVGSTAPTTDAYFAEGYTGHNFQEYITIANPNNTDENVSVDYLLQSGIKATRQYAVTHQSRITVDVNQEVGPNQSVAAHVHSTGTFIAERPMYFDYGPGWTGGHDAVGASAPGHTFYFAEGYTGGGFNEYLTLANPNPSDADVDITYFTSGAPKVVEKVIPATSRVTVNVNDPSEGVGAGQNVSIEVTNHTGNSISFIAERPMYFDYQNKWTGGHDVVGATALSQTMDLAEGYVSPNQFDEYLTILNPGSTDANVTITYECQGSTAPHCGDAGKVTQVVPAHSRGTRYVNDDFPGLSVAQSVHITSDQPVLVERPMYFNYQSQWNGGHDAIAVDEASLSSSYSFAEGYVASNFQEYLTILNNNAFDVDVTITYYVQGGSHAPGHLHIPANSRGTYFVNGDFTSATSESVTASAVQSSDGTTPANILAERPMYFAY